MGFEFHLQKRLEAVLLRETVAPVSIDALDQAAADLARRDIVPRGAERDEHGIGVAVNDTVTLVLDQFHRLPDDVVTALRNRARQARIVQAAAGRAEYAVE